MKIKRKFKKFIVSLLIFSFLISLLVNLFPQQAQAAPSSYCDKGQENFNGFTYTFSKETRSIIITKNGTSPFQCKAEANIFEYAGIEKGTVYFRSKPYPSYYLLVDRDNATVAALAYGPNPKESKTIFSIFPKILVNSADFKASFKGYNIYGSIKIQPGFTFPIQGVTVRIKDLKTGNELAPTTGIVNMLTGSGVYTFYNIPPGEYRIWIKETNWTLVTTITQTQEACGYGGSITVTVKDQPLSGKEAEIVLGNLDTAECLLFRVLDWGGQGMEAVLKWVKWVASSLITIPTDPSNDTVNKIKTIWQELVNICNVLFILGLIIIIFANLLRIQLDYYSIKVLLPRLIIAMIMINFSFLIAAAILDFSNLLGIAFKNLAGLPAREVVLERASGAWSSLGATSLSIGAAITIIIFLVIAALLGIVLALMLIFRVVIIWLLWILSPVMFLFWVLPFTRSLANRWWSEFTRWVFMGPLVMLFLAIGDNFIDLTQKTIENLLRASPEAYYGVILQLIVVAVTILAAIAVPSILGGQIMGAFKGMLGKVGGKALGWLGTTSIGQFARMPFETRRAAAAEKAAARWGAIGRRLGLKGAEAMGESGIASAAKRYNMREMNPEELARQGKSKNQAVRDAARRELLGRGLGAEYEITPQTATERELAFSRSPVTAVSRPGMTNEEISNELVNQVSQGRVLDPLNMNTRELGHQAMGLAYRRMLDDKELQARANSQINTTLKAGSWDRKLAVLKNAAPQVAHQRMTNENKALLVETALRTGTPEAREHFNTLRENLSPEGLENVFKSLHPNIQEQLKDQFNEWKK